MGRVAVAVAILSAMAGAAGCEVTVPLTACDRPDSTHVGPDGTLDPCYCQTPDAGDVGERQPGYCEMYLAAGKDGGASPEGP